MQQVSRQVGLLVKRESNMEEHDNQLQVIQAFSLRDLIVKANSLGLKKEEIINILPDTTENGYYLVYFR